MEKNLIEEHNKELDEAIKHGKAVVANTQSLIESMGRMKNFNERRLATLKVKATPYTPTLEKPKRVKHTAGGHRDTCKGDDSNDGDNKDDNSNDDDEICNSFGDNNNSNSNGDDNNDSNGDNDGYNNDDGDDDSNNNGDNDNNTISQR
ncbi:putative uncharacterized protein DDB_G0283051 [Jatropha curcas]|uniref:putative uncharacterized protein DDB_G0283051 n=1 Tax=Jatropha curcas TaxID=180498 RepID=UPI0005FB937F|nr:putative uncharacterized protein DDB_G0283051 [Jatropha curcas]